MIVRQLRILFSITCASIGLLAPRAVKAEEGDQLELQALMASAERHHPSLAKRPLLEKSGKLQRSRLNRGYLPRLSLGGRATWQSAVTEVDVPVPGITIDPPPRDQYQATLDLNQTIWDGGVISDQKKLVAASMNVEQERVSLEWYHVRERILELYFAGIVQQELKQQGETLADYVGTLIEKTELLVEQGLAIERDVLLLKARQLEARKASVDARENLNGVRKSLQELTGQPVSESSIFASPKQTCSASAQKRPEASEIKRPELNVLRAEEQLLDVREKAARAGDRPKLGAFATAGYGRPGLNMLSDEFDFYFIGGVQLTVPLTYLYTGSHQNGDQQVALQRSLLARERDSVMLRVKVEHDAQSTALGRLDEILALDEQLLKVRESARKQTEVQIELGTATTSDLISDLTQEDQAKSQRAVHRAERSLACHELAFIRGEL